MGINSAYHESAVCLLHNGQVIAAVEEERFNRIKRGKLSAINNADTLPVQAINYCLDQAGIRLSDVNWIGYSIDPYKRVNNGNFVDKVIPDSWGSREGEELFYQSIQNVPAKLRGMGFIGTFKWCEHHLCHAASAFYPSPFDEAAVMVVDGIGETDTASVFEGRNTVLERVKQIDYPASIGFLWEKISQFIGFTEYDSCKVMGLAAYGNPELYRPQFRDIVQLHDDGTFTIDNGITQFRSETYDGLEQLFGIARRQDGEQLNQSHMDVAASLQEITEEAVVHLAKAASSLTGSRNLCLAGGVALNCIANRAIEKTGLFDNIYIQPAANDAGTALGAAYLVWYQISEDTVRSSLKSTYLGPEYNNKEILEALQGTNLQYRLCDDIAAEAADLLSQGRLVGWFQGAMEFGPRALGNRSLLANPSDYETRNKINHAVKHREHFRPFAPSVLEEEAAKWFDCDRPALAAEYMLIGYKVHEDKRERIPAVVHKDGTCRVQIVKQAGNPAYYKLISKFYQLTGVPILLNTSLNDSEPIVCSPTDAVQTFIKTQIDYLAIGDYLVYK